MASSHLALTDAADGVENIEQLITDNFEQVDQAMNGGLTHTDTVTFSLTAAEFTSEFIHTLTGSTAGQITLNVPASRRVFAVRNSTGNAVLVQVTGGGGAGVLIRDGELKILLSDATDILETRPPRYRIIDHHQVAAPGNSQKIYEEVLTRNYTLPSGATGSQGYANTTATSAATVDILKNGSSVGTVNFASATAVATFTVSPAATFVAGDRIGLQGQTTADATLADFLVALRLLETD